MRFKLILLLCLFHAVNTTFTPSITKYSPNAGSNTVRSSFTDGTYGYYGTDDAIFKVDLSTNNVVGTINLNSGETYVMVAFRDGTTGYFGLQTNPGIIIKVDLTAFTRTSTLTLTTGDTYMRSGFVVGSYLYFGTGVIGQANRIIKIDKSTFTRSAALEYGTSYGGCLSGVTDGTYGYFSFDASGGTSQIIKITLSTFTQAAALSLNGADDYPNGPVIAGGNLYYGVWDSSSSPALTSAIVKINLGTFTRTTSVSALGNAIYGGVSDGTYGYFTTNGATKDTYDSVVRLKYSDNTVTQLALNVGEFAVITAFVDSGKAYIGIGSLPAAVVIIDTSTFTRSGAFQFKTTTNLGCVVADSTYFYFATSSTSTSYGFISKINRSTGALVDILGLNYLEGNTKACFIEGTNAYFAAKTSTITNPSVIVKVDLNTFTRTSALTLSAPNVNSVVKVGDYAYFGSSTNPGRITKMQISTFAEVSTISLNVTTAGQLVKNMDVALSDGTYGYFGSGGDSPGKVVKVTLASLAVGTVTTFGAGVTNVRSGTIYGSHAFYGTQSGHIVKILLSDLSIVSTTALTSGTINVNTANVYGSYIYFANSGTTTLNATIFKYDPSASTYEGYPTSTLYSLVPSYNDGAGSIFYGTNTYPAYVYKVIVDTSCPSAVGGALNSGDSRTVYSASSSCDTTCTGIQGTISCTSGVLSGDTTFQYTSCTPSGTYTCGCLSAVGGELLSGNTRTVYSASSSCDTTCTGVQGTISCTNGVLSGATTYQYTSCTPSGTYTCGCLSAVGGELLSGESREVFSSSSSCNTTCDGIQGIIFCTAGVLSGDTSFDYANCTPSETYSCGCVDAVGGELMNNNTRDVYSAASHCSTSCEPVRGEIMCTDGVLSGDTSFTFGSCNPSATDTCGQGQTSGDPHFYGFRGQKYDVMGQSFEIYNIITSSYMQINSRFIPYYKVWDQIIPTGTMMGELGIRLNNHRFRVFANETTAILDGTLVSMEESWSVSFGNDIVLSNYAKKGDKHEIIVETKDLFITFIRKVYTVAVLEDQWHYDYKAKLITDGSNLHGLLGQSWEEKHFAEKSGTAFQYLDGFEEDYRLESNNIFGTDFTYNKFVNM